MSTATLADLSTWPTDCGDTCGNVFGLALRQAARHAGLTLPEDAAVLEIGCAEFDWMTQAHRAWPQMALTGIDWRGAGEFKDFTRIQGDVMIAPFALASFDWITSISAMEHIGLGHYNKDPVHADGDAVAMRNAFGWLKPGGWLYCDVPWNAGTDAYEVVGTSHRVYDDATIQRRLIQDLGWTLRWSAAVGSSGGDIVVDPPRLDGGQRFYYKMLWLQKA